MKQTKTLTREQINNYLAAFSPEEIAAMEAEFIANADPELVKQLREAEAKVVAEMTNPEKETFEYELDLPEDESEDEDDESEYDEDESEEDEDEE